MSSALAELDPVQIVLLTAALVALSAGSVAYAFATWQRLRPGSEAKLLRAAQTAAFESFGHGVVVIEDRKRVLAASDRARSLLKLSIDAKTGGLTPSPQLMRLMSQENFSEGELLFRTGPKTERRLEVRVASPPGSEWPDNVLVIALREVTHHRDHEDRLRRLAYFDSLTGLANRRAFMDGLETAIRDEKSGRFALMYIDLDGFKQVNDTMGHSAGDEVLRTFAQRLRQQMRRGAAHGFAFTQIARLGGDEFAIIVNAIESPDEVIGLANQVLKTIEEPIWIGSERVHTSVSIGISLFPADGRDLESLIQRADAALYQAKERGRNRFEFFTTSLDDDAHRKLIIKKELAGAIDREQFALHYQPKFDLIHRQVVGSEALLRWDSEGLGPVGPSEFIPVAESAKLIVTIGRWVVERACQQIRDWQLAGLQVLPVAVNVSSYQFAEPGFSGLVAETLRRHDVDPSLLEIELTESALLDDNEITNRNLDELRGFGVRIALDDFGTGYSALSYLTRLPLDTLKIDRSLARSIDTDPAARGITAGVISMAQSLGLKVVAEGIDHEDLIPVLQELGCDEGQGFVFSEALPADEFAELLSLPTSEAITAPVLPDIEEALAGEGLDLLDPSARGPALIRGTGPGVVRVRNSAVGYALLIDDGVGSLSPMASVLQRVGGLGLHALHAKDAAIVARLEAHNIRTIVLGAGVPVAVVDEIRTVVDSAREDASTPLVVCGVRPDAERVAELRDRGVSWALWTPADEQVIRFVIGTAMEMPSPFARGLSAPVSLDASIVRGERADLGRIATLAATGAFVEMPTAAEVGELLCLGFVLDGDELELDCRVSRAYSEQTCWSLGRPSGASVLFDDVSADQQTAISAVLKERLERFRP